MDKLTTVVTERGQVSIPPSLRKELGLKTGQPLVWGKNFRSGVFGENSTEKGTTGRNGDAWICCTILGEKGRRTAKVVAELREGER